MAWGIWQTVFHDNKANMALYDAVAGKVEVRDDVIHLGTTEVRQRKSVQYVIESFIRPRLARYQDVDISVKLEIGSTVKTEGDTEDLSCWFGIAPRALRPDHWDAYLFYIRKNGRVEFGIKGKPIEKPPAVPAVASQPVTLRIRVEGDRAQTWVNDRAYHDWRDEQREFIRMGDIFLIAYGAIVKINEVEIKVKRRYAPLLDFGRRFWLIIVGISVIIGIVAGIVSLLSRR
jgi:hypothetical protein